MANYRVKTRVFCTGRQYEPGDECSEIVARALGSDAEKVAEKETVPPVRQTKPITKAQLK